MFAREKDRKINVVGSYYWSLAYEDLEKKLQVKKRFGEEYRKATAESFWRRALRMSRVFTETIGQTHTVWVVPASF